MVIRGEVVAGTEEKSDVQILISPCETGRQIQIAKIPHPRFVPGEERLIRQILDEEGVQDVRIEVKDFGALDFVIVARLRAGLRIAGRESAC